MDARINCSFLLLLVLSNSGSISHAFLPQQLATHQCRAPARVGDLSTSGSASSGVRGPPSLSNEVSPSWDDESLSADTLATIVTGEKKELNDNNFDNSSWDMIFDAVDVDGSGSIDLEELVSHLSSSGYSRNVIETLHNKMADQNGEISRAEFRRVMESDTLDEKDADLIFALVDTDGSGAIDLEELTNHLLSSKTKGDESNEDEYTREEIETLFSKIDTDRNNEISREEFRIAILDDNNEADDDICPRGYFLNSVKEAFVPLGPIGRLSQKVETSGPLKRIYEGISNLFGIDTKKISKLGVPFALSYSIISNINGAFSFSAAWYIACKRTGLSPLVPGQWRSLVTSYGMIYGLVQLLRPFRVAAAIAMSKLSAEYLEMTQDKLNCSRTMAIVVQYLMGWVMMGSCAIVGIGLVSWSTGVPIY